MRTLIHNACVLTVDARQRVFDPGFVVIEGPVITAVGPERDLPIGQFDRTIDAKGMVLTPGLINMHQHLHLHLLKGLADGLLLEPWVFTLTMPFRPYIDAEALQMATQLGTLEMLRTGTTCVLNHHGQFEIDRFREMAIDTMGSLGIRHLLALPFQCRTPKQPDFPHSAQEASDRLASFIDSHDGAWDGLTRLGLVVECNAHHTALGRSSDELVMAGYRLAVERDLRIAVHMSGGTLSMSMGFTKYRRQTGRSDVEYLAKLGVLDKRWILKHGIHFSDDDMAAVQQSGASVVYTPTSEAVRGGGFGPWTQMRRLGINCALGSDGPAVDYSIDMVEQMRACCYLQATRYRDGSTLSAYDALEMATIDAARALGMNEEIGSIECGKQADLVLFDLSRPHQQMVSDPVQRLVRTGRGTDAHTVFVRGVVRIEDRKFTQDIDVGEFLDRARDKARKAVEHAGLTGRAQPQWAKSAT